MKSSNGEYHVNPSCQENLADGSCQTCGDYLTCLLQKYGAELGDHPHAISADTLGEVMTRMLADARNEVEDAIRIHEGQND